MDGTIVDIEAAGMQVSTACDAQLTSHARRDDELLGVGSTAIVAR